MSRSILLSPQAPPCRVAGVLCFVLQRPISNGIRVCLDDYMKSYFANFNELHTILYHLPFTEL